VGEVPLVGLGESELERLLGGCWERSQKLIPETSGSILEGTIMKLLLIITDAEKSAG